MSSGWRAVVVRTAALVPLLIAVAVAETRAGTTMEATSADIHAYFAGKQMKVLTFLGYAAAGYEDAPAMLAAATKVLAEHDPRTTIVNIGATAVGIGAVYEVAKRQGFPTTGIVSTLARDEHAPLSPHVDVVFYVKDATWGGRVPGTDRLSPTSAAMVENSDILVAIGGGDVTRDELAAAKRAGKSVRFIAAEMNHAKARAKAQKKGLPMPTAFGGSAGDAQR